MAHASVQWWTTLCKRFHINANPEKAALQVDERMPPNMTEMHNSTSENLDIEHVSVQNDPREWSSLRNVRKSPSTSTTSILLLTFLFPS